MSSDGPADSSRSVASRRSRETVRVCRGAAVTRPSAKNVMLRWKSSCVNAFEAITVISLASQRAALMVAGWARKLRRDTRPPERVRSTAVWSRLGTPAHSKTTSAPRPRVCACTAVGRLVRADRRGRPELETDASSHLRRFDDHHVAGSGGTGELHREQPDGTRPLDDDGVTGDDARASHAVERDRRRFDLRRLDVGEVGVGMEDSRRFDVDAGSEATVGRGERIPAPGDGRHPPAVLAEPALALRARAARRRNGDDHPIAVVEALDRRPDIGDGADPLVPAHRRAVEVAAAERRDVGPADAAERDVDGDATRARTS